MKSYFTIAWRNIWRNKRRTLITAASIFFALFFALLMRSMQIGVYGQMKKNAVESFSGAIQIHANGYWNDKVIDKAFDIDKSMLDSLRAAPSVRQVSLRIETGLLAAHLNKSKFAMVIGSDLKIEDENMNLKDKLVKGDMPQATSNDILIAEGLAKYLKLNLGDSVIFKGQGYHGQTAEGLYRVGGILKFPVKDLNDQVVFVNLPTAQDLFGLEDKATTLALNIEELRTVESVKAQLTKYISEGHEIMTWTELNPTLHQQIESDQKSGLLMLYMLYLIVGFGIIGTVIMMTAERRREFSVMIALGMRKTKLAFIMVIELFYLGIISVLSGALASVPFLYYWFKNPIPVEGDMAKTFESYGMSPEYPFAFELSFYLVQSETVFIIVMLCALLPIFSITKLKVVEALRQ